MIVLRERNDGDVRRFEESLKMAKAGIMEACEIFQDMKDQFSERSGYGERYGERGGYYNRDHYGERGGYYRRDDWDEMSERRYRDSMGRYR